MVASVSSPSSETQEIIFLSECLLRLLSPIGRLCVPKEEGKFKTGVSPDRLGELIAEKASKEVNQNWGVWLKSIRIGV